jgi:bifunctional non-homologous end joining protein LigD
MKALPVKELPDGDWLYEIKHDGYRALAFKDSKELRLISRNNKPLNCPMLHDALKRLPAERVILDGEMAALDEKGRSSFQFSNYSKCLETSRWSITSSICSSWKAKICAMNH